MSAAFAPSPPPTNHAREQLRDRGDIEIEPTMAWVEGRPAPRAIDYIDGTDVRYHYRADVYLVKNFGAIATVLDGANLANPQLREIRHELRGETDG